MSPDRRLTSNVKDMSRDVFEPKDMSPLVSLLNDRSRL